MSQGNARKNIDEGDHYVALQKFEIWTPNDYEGDFLCEMTTKHEKSTKGLVENRRIRVTVSQLFEIQRLILAEIEKRVGSGVAGVGRHRPPPAV